MSSSMSPADYHLHKRMRISSLINPTPELEVAQQRRPQHPKPSKLPRSKQPKPVKQPKSQQPKSARQTNRVTKKRNTTSQPSSKATTSKANSSKATASKVTACKATSSKASSSKASSSEVTFFEAPSKSSSSSGDSSSKDSASKDSSKPSSLPKPVYKPAPQNFISAQERVLERLACTTPAGDETRGLNFCILPTQEGLHLCRIQVWESIFEGVPHPVLLAIRIRYSNGNSYSQGNSKGEPSQTLDLAVGEKILDFQLRGDTEVTYMAIETSRGQRFQAGGGNATPREVRLGNGTLCGFMGSALCVSYVHSLGPLFKLND